MKILLAVWLLILSSPTWAAVEYHDFKQPEQEQAYQNLIAELRCLVCQNQTIADSNADLAKDLRRQVYEMLQQGQSEQQIINFMTQRYGDFVLYKPAFTFKTALLWLGPLLLLMSGLVALWLVVRRKKQAVKPVLSTSEKTRLQQILEKGEED
ncbi:cytochrome c-type biogenesis protein CcmH [Methylomonas paludis]|uniref:Cytochrome c-type biogenesis protein n=1 Tax=Methylomonas paludis TaxID=1173101 RepID=A0A975MLA5_9GAMM|nr:cytochrome c-type biogenesis protein [Methylomonas paludis]QWF69431.1 cytochrome c-type biogenesis protein CcmH [Methylomonas paludis]